MELDTERAASIEAEALDGADMPEDFLGYSQDAFASVYGRHLIRHLRRPEIDPLFAEGLGLAIVARSIGLARRDGRFHASDGLCTDDPRITRVIDYIETHFGDELSEPRRVCRRLQILRGWSHDDTLLPGSPGAGCSAGYGA